MSDQSSPAIDNNGKNTMLEMNYLTSDFDVGFSNFFKTKFEFFKF